MSFVDELKAELEKTGFGGVEPSLDGEWQRFGPNQAYRLISEEAGGVIKARWVDMREGEWHFHQSEGEWTDEQQAAFDEKYKAIVEEREALNSEVAARAQTRWESADPVGDSPYLTGKGLTGLYRCRMEARSTLVSAQDVDGKIWSIQTIDADNPKFKPFMAGGRKTGCFHWMGTQPEQADRFYICEGIATAASVWEAMKEGGGSVLCAFDAGNVVHVARNIRAKYGSGVELTICGDVDGARGAGQRKAKEAAGVVGGKLALPKGLLTGSDFNDLAQEAGIDAVRDQIMRVVRRGKELHTIDGGTTKQGIPKAPKEAIVVDRLIQYFGDWACSQDGILFLFNGVHWEEATADHVASVKQKLRILYGHGFADTRRMESAFKHFVIMVRKVPSDLMPNGQRKTDLLRVNPMAVNFENGSLWCVKQKDRTYRLLFKEGHHPDDWLTTVLPYKYRENYEKNEMFDDMMERIFLGDPDAEEKKRAVAQMFGACLLPAFPRLFFLHGKSGTGKSTVINLATKLVSLKNTCGVEPHQFKGFLMEDMQNKLINCVTDVTLEEPIADSVVKQIIDRKPMYIQRKGIKNIMGWLPPIHIFGGNGIPKTLDGGSGAHERRWTFIGFDHVQYVEGESDQDYWDTVYEAGPEGILDFALRGLRDLCTAKGHFCQPESGRKRLKEWEDEDQVGEFLSEVRSDGGLLLVKGNCQVKEADEACLVRKMDLYEYYKCWHEEAGGAVRQLGRYLFYRKVEQRGLLKKKDDAEGWCYKGFTMTPGPKASN